MSDELLIATETEVLVVVQTESEVLEIIEAGPQGARGLAGPPGDAVGLLLTAVAAVGGHRVMALLGGASAVRHANMHLADDAALIVGISSTAASPGEQVKVVAGALLEEPSWAWSQGPVYATGDGMLTQALPAPPDTFILQLGVAASATSILVQIGTPIFF